jgi:uncharacterized protein (UPF0332 family)
MKHNPTEIIKHHITQAERALRESNILNESKCYGGSLNRSYYSIYHSVKALLESKGIETKSHSGLLVMFQEHFVKPGYFSRSFLINLKDSENLREKSDYKNFFTASSADAQEQIKNASLFLEESIKFLEKNMNISNLKQINLL